MQRRFGNSRLVRLCALLFVGFSLALPSVPGASAAPMVNGAALEAAQQPPPGTDRISYHRGTGKARFVSGAPGRPIRRPAGVDANSAPEAAARAFLREHGRLFGLRDQARELRVARERSTDRGRGIVRFQQLHQGVPVVGGELVVQLDAARNIVSANGEALPDLGLDVAPTVNAATAQQRALELVAKSYNLGAAELGAATPELWIYDPVLLGGPGAPFSRLVWRLEVTANDLQPVRELVLVDATRGSIALHFNQVDAALNRKTYTANNGTTLRGTLVCTEANPTCVGGDSHAVAAHLYAKHTYDYYLTTHGRDSIDNAGMPLVQTVHYGSNYVNAFWNGSQMVYGDGCAFPLASDVVAHELTHGVTEREAGLFYYYQSGAINESLSDVWGEFVDLTDGAGDDSAASRWQIGEEATGCGALRNMQNPPAFNDPDSMTSTHYYLGAQDSGGVHYNSGVNNKAVSLMVDGGDFNGKSVAALGFTKVAKIYYEVQTNLLVSGSDYADLYDLVYQGCLNLVGTAGINAGDCQEVRDATDAVAMNQQPAAGYNEEAPMCAPGLRTSSLFFDNLESGAGRWSFGKVAGTSRWRRDAPEEYGPFAHSGAHFLYADDYPESTSDSFAAMNTSVRLPAGAYLHFAHAYGFEDPNYDGGVLEYSTNSGGTWRDAGALFTHNGYRGTLSTSNGNPLGARAAFVGDSHGYISSRLNLESLAGQNVRFRWRMGIDNEGYDWGWWLDDVRIYTCATSVVSGFTPTSGPVGTRVVIQGSDFTGATGVKFNGVGATFTVLSSTSIQATVPARATTGRIWVTTPDGTAVSPASFKVTPIISGFTPTSGPVGTRVEIQGSGFTGATSVKFNGVRATLTFLSSTRIRATVPTRATTGRITVTTPGGTATSRASFRVLR